MIKKPEEIHQEEVVRSLMNDIEEMEDVDSEVHYLQTMKKIGRKKKIITFSRWMRYAAILVLPLFVSTLLLGYLYFEREAVPIRYAEIFASQGAVLRFVLPDSSVVWLNSGSRLKYPMSFVGDKREVALNGEGYFEVKADKKHPFYVIMPDGLSVYVYGTHFNINAYGSDPTIETVLEEGHLNVTAPDNRSEAELLPGESAIYDKRQNKLIKLKVEDVYQKMAWREGKLIFRQATLNEIFRVLERHFNVKINFKNYSGRIYHFRATFANETLAQILDYLSLSVKMKWNMTQLENNSDSVIPKQTVNVNLY